MKPNIEKLKEVIKKFDEERWRLQKIIRDLEETPKIKALVGKYFKYHNSYNQKESWWVYYCIKEFKKDTLLVDYFEEDTRSKIEIFFNKTEYGLGFYNPNYIEITKEEYEMEAAKLIKKLNKRLK